jgi:hypothetical protein
MHRWAAFLLLGLTVAAAGQNPSKAQRGVASEISKQSSEKLLSEPMDWQDFSVRMLPDSQVSMSYNLVTSWIPGPDHKGMLRYKLRAAPDIYMGQAEPKKYPEVATPVQVDAFIRRIKKFQINLVFYDENGFIVRKIPIDFSFGVNEDDNVASLVANEAVQMDMDEYKNLIAQGSWQISRGIFS